MKLELDIQPESVQEQSGSLGTITYYRGRKIHRVAFRANKQPGYSVNGEKKPLKEMPDTIYKVVGSIAVNMGWISPKQAKKLH